MYKNRMNNKTFLTLLFAVSCSVMMTRDIHVSVNGNDVNLGSANSPYRTINKAAKEAVPGDVITVHEGTYRELVRPQRSGTKDKPIVYQAAEVKGW